MDREIKTEITTTCKDCDVRCQRFGTHRNGLRRFRCPQCHRTYTEPHRLTLGEMYLSEDKMVIALKLLLEGNSIRSTMRITGLDQNTITKALILAGERCEKVIVFLGDGQPFVQDFVCVLEARRLRVCVAQHAEIVRNPNFRSRGAEGIQPFQKNRRRLVAPAPQ